MVSIEELNKKSRPYFDRLYFACLNKDKQIIYNKKEQAELLCSIINYKIDLSNKQTVKMFTCVFANLFDAAKKDIWIGIPRRNKKIEEQLNYDCREFLALIDHLIFKGLLEQIIGNHQLHKTTIIKPSKHFVDLIKSLNMKSKIMIEEILVELEQEQIIQFDLTSKQKSRYLEDNRNEYVSILDKLKLINRVQEQVILKITEEGMEEGGIRGTTISESSCPKDGLLDSACDITLTNNSSYYIQFGKSFNEHGRLYSLIQNSSKRENRVNWLLNNKKVIEIDYKACHLTMLYDMNGIDRSEIADMYTLQYDQKDIRDFYKAIAMMLINCKNKAGAIMALRNKCLNQELKIPEGFYLAELKEYVNQFIEFHKPIKHYLFDQGLRLMNFDSKIALEIMYQFSLLEKPIIGIHDSFVVIKEDEDFLKSLMVKYWKEILKTNTEPMLKKIEKEML